jgi:hypothetical protein
MCIIQDFKQEPDSPATIQIVSGDGGQPLGDNFLGKTYKEVFESRLRIGTFSTTDMPNHGFLAILTEWQCNTALGKKWLKILKDNGFEFIRTVDNSVYSGSALVGTQSIEDYEGCEEGCDEACIADCNGVSLPGEDSKNKNYLFGLFRNIGNGRVLDPFEPPKAWKDIEGGVPSVNDELSEERRSVILSAQEAVQRESWERIGPPKFYTRAELEKEKLPITLAGQRSKFPQQLAKVREKLEKESGKAKTSAPFKAADSKKLTAF